MCIAVRTELQNAVHFVNKQLQKGNFFSRKIQMRNGCCVIIILSYRYQNVSNGKYSSQRGIKINPSSLEYLVHSDYRPLIKGFGIF